MQCLAYHTWQHMKAYPRQNWLASQSTASATATKLVNDGFGEASRIVPFLAPLSLCHFWVGCHWFTNAFAKPGGQQMLSFNHIMTKYNHLHTLKSILHLSRKNIHDTCLKMVKKILFKEATPMGFCGGGERSGSEYNKGKQRFIAKEHEGLTGQTIIKRKHQS